MAAAGVFDLELNEATNEQDGSSDVSDEEQIAIDEDQVRVCCICPSFSLTHFHFLLWPFDKLFNGRITSMTIWLYLIVLIYMLLLDIGNV